MFDNVYDVPIIPLVVIICLLILGLVLYLILKPKRVVEKYDTGEKRYVYHIKEGKRVGKETVFYRSGKKNKEKYYEQGVLNGRCITYYETGARYIEAFYENGKLKGEYKIYEEDGPIKEVRTYN